MGWVHSGWNAISSLLSYGAEDAGREPPGLEAARGAMLGALADGGRAGHYLHLQTRVRFAKDALALWYLRSEVSMALSRARGEGWAAGEMDRITRCFDGLVPAPLWRSARPGPRRAVRV